MNDQLKLVIITGMSGAGKTVALQSFEDMGYYCVDNMPPSLLPKFWDLIKETGKISKICLVIDLRSRSFFDELVTEINGMDNTNTIEMSVLFLEADDQTLVARYKETRRAHPLQKDGVSVLEAIQKEKILLNDIRKESSVIDTTNLTPRKFRELLLTEFQSEDQGTFTVNVISFGFKYGLPIDSDIVMDVRFLPNPHYIDELRPMTGLDAPVYDYVMSQPETETFYRKFTDLLDFELPLYEKEGKSSLTITIGCTGGQHRSIALTVRIAHHIQDLGYMVNIIHQERKKRKESMNVS